jgi:hypothetical protein
MNKTAKTSLIVLGAIVIIGILFNLNGWSVGENKTVVDGQYGNLNGSQSDSSSTNSSDGSNGQTKTTTTTTTSTTNKQTAAVPSDSSLLALIGNTTLRVPQTGVDVKLNAGEANFTDSAVKGHVSIGRVLGKVPTDSGYDVFVDMSISQDLKPAVIHQVALFRYVNQVVSYTSAVSIGDRLGLYSITAIPDASTEIKPPQSFMTSSIGYTLTLSYLDRKNGEPLTTAPSLPKTMSLRVKNHVVAK